MRLRNLWKPILAAVVFLLAMMYNISVRTTEGFQAFNWTDFMNQLRRAQGQQEQLSAYDKWIGYLYKYPADSGKSLNDFKSRAFYPSCEFRMNWATHLPPGSMRPTAAPNGTEANVAYRSFLDCLASKNQDCLMKLEDVRKRFMQPGCSFLNPSNASTYNRNYQAVFKDKP